MQKKTASKRVITLNLFMQKSCFCTCILVIMISVVIHIKVVNKALVGTVALASL